MPAHDARQDRDQGAPLTVPQTRQPVGDGDGVVQQADGGQDGRGLAEPGVGGGASAPQHGIIHGRQVVDDQGRGMHHFQGDGHV